MTKEIKNVDNVVYEFQSQTLGSRITKQSILAQRARGVYGLMTISADQKMKESLDLLDVLATLDTSVVKMDEENKPDFNFSFFDLDLTEENLQHVMKVYKDYTEWQDSFRKKKVAVKE